MQVFYLLHVKILTIFRNRYLMNIQNLVNYVNLLFQIQRQNVLLQLEMLYQLKLR